MPSQTIQGRDSNNQLHDIRVDGNGQILTVPSSSSPTKKIVDETTTTGVTYVGEAPLGAPLSSAVWRIQKIDETGSVMVIMWSGVNVIWDNRATSVVYT